MAAYMRCWLLESKLHMLSRSVKGSCCGNLSFQSRNFLRCAKIYKRENAEITSSCDKNKDRPSSNSKERNVQKIDQKFIDSLFEKDKEWKVRGRIGSHSSDRGEFFKQSWHSKLDSVSRDTFRMDLHEEVPPVKKVATETSSGNSFGHLHGQDDGISKRLDRRDHNERIDKEYPNDLDEERDWRQNIPLTRYGRLGRKAFYYTKKMTNFGREGKIKEAIQVFDEWMMVQDRVLPSKRTFVTLIGILGRAGYTRKAFQLFRQMKHLGLDPPDHVYTSLFNACANCPVPDYGLKQASDLYEQMKLLEIPSNHLTVMASMKAFSMLGDFSKAFQILDEKGVSLDNQCFNALLVACAVDKESGFRRALKVWQTMRENNVTPTQDTFNLLLRCVRDCGVGDVKALAEDLGLQGQGQKEELTLVNLFISDNDAARLTSGQELCKKENIINVMHERRRKSVVSLPRIEGTTSPHSRQELKESIPSFENLSVSVEESQNVVSRLPRTEDTIQNEIDTSRASPKREWWENSDKPGRQNQDPLRSFPHATDVEFGSSDQMTKLAMFTKEDDYDTKLVNVAELVSKPGRLSLIGGMASLVTHMLHHGIQPDIRTFTEILSCVENNAEMEAMVLRMMEAVGVAPDIDFLNDIMMRRNIRHEKLAVKEVLVLMSKLRLTPNMRTYAAMALTCHTWRDAVALMDDMEAANVEPSIEIMGHFVYASLLNFRYKRFLLQEVEDMGLKPSRRIIGMVEKSIGIAKRYIAKAEQRTDHSNKRYITPKFQREFSDFLRFYESWLRRTELHQEKDPWESEGYPENDSKKDKPLHYNQKLN